MAITLTTDQRTALNASTLKVRHGAKIDLDSGEQAFWQGSGTFTYDGTDYLGVGQYGSVQPITQTGNLVASGVELILSGLDQDAAADPGDLYTALDDEDFHGRAVEVWRFYFEPEKNRNSNAELVLAERLYKGFADRSERVESVLFGSGQEGSLTSQLSLFSESRAIEYGRSHRTLRSNEHQQRLFSGDDFFEYTPLMRNRQFFWGRVPQSTGSGGASVDGNGGGFRPQIQLY